MHDPQHRAITNLQVIYEIALAINALFKFGGRDWVIQ